ncbi:MAG: hypothetical protein ACXWX7_20135, partial [Candidatus Binatia bacterium]
MIVLLIIHGLLAVALLGAITHQAIGVWLPARPGPESFIRRMRSVSTASHVTAFRRMGHRAMASWLPGAVSAHRAAVVVVDHVDRHDRFRLSTQELFLAIKTSRT